MREKITLSEFNEITQKISRKLAIPAEDVKETALKALKLDERILKINQGFPLYPFFMELEQTLNFYKIIEAKIGTRHLTTSEEIKSAEHVLEKVSILNSLWWEIFVVAN